MKEIGSLMFLYTETPLHAGSGSGLGAVDLPLQRERMSHLPMVQSSGIKGAWREELTARAEAHDKNEKDPAKRWQPVVERLFGPPPPEPGKDKDEEKDREEFAGALSLTDARLLLFPVRTVWGGWAWTTCPMVLERLCRDLEVVGVEAPSWRGLRLGEDEKNEAWIAQKSHVAKDKRLLIEDLDYAAQEQESVGTLAGWLAKNAFPTGTSYGPFRDRLSGQLAVLRDDEFRFLTQHATEVVARIRIDRDSGTVEEGALWSEESLPAESVLWSVALCGQERLPAKRERQEGAAKPVARTPQQMWDRFWDLAHQVPRVRLGGDRTVGRGIAGVRLLEVRHG